MLLFERRPVIIDVLF